MQKPLKIQTPAMRSFRHLAVAYNPNDGVLVTTGRKEPNGAIGLCVWTDDMSQCEFHDETPPNCRLFEGDFPWGSFLTFSKNGKYLVSGNLVQGNKWLQVFDGANAADGGTKYRFIKSFALVPPPFRDGERGEREDGDYVDTAVINFPPVFSPAEEARLMVPSWSVFPRVCDLETGNVVEYRGSYAPHYFCTFYFKKEISDDAREQSREFWIWGGSFQLESKNIESGETVVREFDDEMSRSHIWLEKSEQIFSIAGSGNRKRRGEVLILSGDSLETQDEYKIPISGTVKELAYSSFDDLVAIGLANTRILLWDVKKREIRGRIPGVETGYFINGLAFSPRDSSLSVVYRNNDSDDLIVYRY